MVSQAELIAQVTAQLEAERRAALGPLREAQDRREAGDERAVRLAADNLLDKALRRLADGDDAAAQRFVERVLALGLEGSEPGEEGALAVHLFVWDALRVTAFGTDGTAWLDRAEAVTAELDDAARREWFDALAALADEDDLPADQQVRVRRLTGRVPDRDPLDDVLPDARPAVVLALLRALLRVLD